MDRMLGYEIDLKADSGLSETSTFPLTGDFQVSAAWRTQTRRRL
jgi:hypothetical protein